MSIGHTGLTYLLLVSLAYIWTLSRDKQKAQVAIKSGARSLLNLLPLLPAPFSTFSSNVAGEYDHGKCDRKHVLTYLKARSTKVWMDYLRHSQ